eukprot:122593_1
MDRETSYDESVPGEVRKFVQRLARAIRDKNVYELLRLYSTEFPRLSQRFYTTSSWPRTKSVAEFADYDDLTLYLYNELYFRHQHLHLELPAASDTAARLNYFMEECLDCWENYINLFNVMIKQAEGDRLELDLPNQWLWDIVDMFVVQFQEWHSLKPKYMDALQEQQDNRTRFESIVESAMDGGSESDVHWEAVRAECDAARIYKEASPMELREMFRFKEKQLPDYQWTEDRHVWSPIVILRYFHALANKGRVHVKYNIRLPHDEFKEQNLSNISRMTAYFAICGLTRVHALCGDYTTALRVLDAVDLSERGSVMNLRGCRVSVSYYRGFCYLMLRRYSDAVKCFEKVLRDELREARQAKEEILNDTIEQTIGRMKALFATAYCLSSERVDDFILGEVRDQFKNEWTGLEKCDEAAYSELFEFGRPDFISLYASESEPSPFRRQLEVFLQDVSARRPLVRLYAYMRLYTSISLEKLGKFLKESGLSSGSGDDDSVLSALLSTKMMSRELKYVRGPPSKGVWLSGQELDFYVEKDAVHITESKPAPQCAQFFLRAIEKSGEHQTTLARLGM